MQTRKFGFRSLALFSVLALGLAACDDTNVVTPPPATTISVSPSGSVELEVGDRITVVASLSNAPSGATVTWASSNNAAATVDGTGNVTAVAPGITTISATAPSTGGGTVSAALAIRVVADGGPTPSDSASINIVSIVDLDNDNVDLFDVEGRIFVRIDYERTAESDSVRVTLVPQGGAVQAGDPYCVQAFNSVAAKATAAGLNLSAAQVEFVCPFNTAQLAADGSPIFENGDYEIIAELFDGTTMQANARRNLTLGNTNTLNFGVDDPETEEQTIGEDGLLWQDGAVTVTVTPAIYSGNADDAIASVTFTAPNGAVIVVDEADADGRFSATFTEGDDADDDGLFELTDDEFEIEVTSITVGGEEGPNAETVEIRYDNEAPDETDVVINEDDDDDFVGTDFVFDNIVVVDGGDPGDLSDIDDNDGVGDVDVRFFIVDDFSDYDAGERDLDVIAEIMEGEEVSDASTFEDGEELEVIALLCDALGNCVVVDGFAFTVDFGDPTIEEVTVDGDEVEDGDQVLNPAPGAAAIQVTVEDDEAGFGATPLLVEATVLNEDGDELCLAFDEDGEVTGTNSGAACSNAPYATDLTVELPATNGYYTYTLIAVDEGGNQSEAFTFTAVVDDADPTVSDIDFDVTLEGGDIETVEADIEDNLDLSSFMVLVNYDGLGQLPQTGFVEVDDTFGAPLTQDESVDASFFFISSLVEDTDGGIDVTEGADYLAEEITVRAFDHSGRNSLDAASTEAIPTVFDPSAFVADGDVTGFDVEAVDDELVLGSSATATVRARLRVDEDNTTNPADRVYFYVRAPRVGGGFHFALVAVDETATITTTTDDRFFAYTAEVSLAHAEAVGAVEDGDTVDVVGIAVNADGEGIVELEVAAIEIVED